MEEIRRAISAIVGGGRCATLTRSTWATSVARTSPGSRKQGRVETSRIDGTKTAQVRSGAEGIDLAAFPKFALAREDRWDAYMREEGKSCGQGDAFLGDGLPEERKGEDTYNCRGGSEGAHPLCR